MYKNYFNTKLERGLLNTNYLLDRASLTILLVICWEQTWEFSDELKTEETGNVEDV